jgi:hypothetical protein
MKIGKNYINQLINEEYDNIILAEMFSKRTANLEEIIDNESNPSKEDVFESDDFQKNLINDLINNKRNVSDWTVFEHSGSMKNLQSTEDDSFNINYEFHFTYNYNGVPIKLSLYITGSVDVNWSGKYISATHWQPAEYSEPEVDYKNLGSMLDVALYDDDGSEIKLINKSTGNKWLTPELEKKVAKSIISPYL